MNESFQAFVVNKEGDNFTREILKQTINDLPEGNVTFKVAYSSVNFKDGLASIPNGNIVKQYPFIPGIDAAGIVVNSSDPRFQEGDQVLVTGYDFGVSHKGGYSEYARVPGDWLVPLPEGLSLKEAMTVGTAGFTAALSVQRLEENGLTPEKGPVLVTGATGGVGSMAISMLSKRGYEIIASTGKESEHEYLLSLGATSIIPRQELTPEKIPPLGKQQWAAAVDPVGGETLAFVLSGILYGGSVAVSGLTGGTKVPTTVFPFILRGVNLLGIDSVYCPMDVRKLLWERMATDLRPESALEHSSREIQLDELPQQLDEILKGGAKGRSVVKLP
ncbi:NADPH:quinone oxidoreductase family protein [Halalkalibacterium ligniniphilum]|uniref:NADPH:quinone oxidoreductase family protein n=1 Tax=Halalkalibacterium ligniniphilum TaxID=1134413 RepID=UPI000349EE45|nr:acryloyl-CoA reductase [Halalkalibacterium ligniniphilum]